MSDGLFAGVRRVFRLGDRIRDLDEELAFHFDATVAELVSEGHTAQSAREEARRRFGDEAYWRRQLARIDRGTERQRRRADLLQTALEHMRFAGRAMYRSPGFTVGVVLTFALGIGANATMFRIVDRLLLSPPAHVRDPEAVIRVAVDRGPGVLRDTSTTFAFPDYTDLRAARTITHVAAYSSTSVTVGTGEDARQLPVVLASASFFPLLGVQPVLGRFPGEEEDRFGAEGTVAISWDLWQESYGGRGDVLGRTISFGGGPYTIVGVAPRGFTGVDLRRVDLWLPLHPAAALIRRTGGWETRRNWYWVDVVARLAPGRSGAAAAAELTTLHLAGRAESIAADSYDPLAKLLALPLMQARGPQAGTEPVVAKWLAGVSLIVLLIACANIANLLLARSLLRRRELAVRVALGVGRGRLLAQQLTEVLLLATFGGAVALLVAQWGSDFVRGALLAPDLYWPPLDGRTALVVLGLSLLAALVAGVLPAVQASRPQVLDSLRSGARVTGGSRRTRAVLTVLQAALSVALLVGAGLFVRSLNRVNAMDIGIEPGPVLVATPVFATSPLTGPEAYAYHARVLERLARVPGVDAAASSAGLPFYSSYGVSLAVPGLDSIPTLSTGGPAYHAVTSGYLRALGLRIIGGRGFEPADDREGAPRVAVINRTMADLLWPGESPLGRCLRIGGEEGVTQPCSEVIGVVENGIMWGLQEDPTMQFFVPLAQRDEGLDPETIIVRAAGDPQGVLPAVRRALMTGEPAIRFAEVMPMAERLAPHTRTWRLGAAMFTAFGLLALLVAAIGLYSLLAFGVAQRRQEIGVRSALGATRERVLGLVLGQGLRLVAVGVGLGLLAALLAAPRLETLLFQTSPRDPLVLATVVLVLMAVAVIAALVPALRATHVPPQEALRAE